MWSKECTDALERERKLGLQNQKQKKQINEQVLKLASQVAKIKELEEDLKAKQEGPLSKSLLHANNMKVKNKLELIEAKKSIKKVQE